MHRLVEGGVLRILPAAERSGPAKVELKVELQEDFTMSQALGLYLLEAIPQLERESPEYAVNVVSLVEAILEDPNAILRKQVDKRKTELIASLKDDGVEYEERMELLDEVEHAEPGKDFIYDTFNEFVRGKPWVKEAGVRPKSLLGNSFFRPGFIEPQGPGLEGVRNLRLDGHL